MSLAEELQMSKPFISLQHELSIALMLTAERFRDYLYATCQKYGITTQQYNMLRILRGSHPNALSCSEINGRMIQRSPDITRLITRLEQHGYVARCRDHVDNRIVRTSILPSGLHLIESMQQDIQNIHTVFSVLSEEESRVVLQALDLVRRELNDRLGE